MLKRTRQQQYSESLSDLFKRYPGVIFVISVPLILVCFVLLLMPPSRSNSDDVVQSWKFLPNYSSPVPSLKTYAVIFDAGSSGSRVHVFCFDQNLDLMHIGKDLELFVQLKPGLSAYAKDPKAAAESLRPLLEKAQNVVPKHMRKTTPVKVGATAGLRQLGNDASERILQAVKKFLKVKSSLKSDKSWVTVLDGTQEGAYQWVTINYLLKILGKKYSDTVGVVDLGGGSVQMAYAISEAKAAKAPRASNEDDTYVKEMFLMGTKYYLYVHSYLHYGLLAARAEILGASRDSESPCVLSGYNGVYSYGEKDYKALGPPSGASMKECREVALKALKVNKTSCSHHTCTFGGVWNGGGGDGQKNLFVASFFYDRAAEAGMIDASKPIAKVHPIDFQKAAEGVCVTKLEDAKSKYRHVDASNLPYLCMDLVYEFTLLVDGFGLSAYAKDPKAAAESLRPLLEKAQNVVPKHMRKTTPVKVGATAGLRQLGNDASERILQAVKKFLKVKSSLKSDKSWVTVLDGTQEGAYQWVTINYLLKILGKKYSDTVGVVDLGGGSVQMAYAISEAKAAKAPRASNEDDTYVKEMFLMGTKYYLYVHSYLHYGLLAARAEILGASRDSESPCVLSGYNGVYSYGEKDYKALGPPSGASMKECREVALKALKVNKTSCSHHTCTFGGVWNGGGGDGQKNLFVASFFYDRAAEAGMIDASKPIAKVHPIDFQKAAEGVCVTKLEDAKSKYRHVDASNLPYLCMDLVYEFTLLVDGFGLDPWQEITLVKKVEYQNSLVEAAWPLGSAIEAVSAAA